MSGGTKTQWEGPAIGLLDLDAFFASVEQLDHPEWRGRPVIVGGDADARGVVATASYEARAFGVRSAMSAAMARRLCPDAIWCRGDFARYRQVSDEVMGIIGDETPYVEQVSIDEAFFDVTPGRFSREDPLEICQRIQRRVAELGVTCSIGIGVCKSVAKVASERDKPRGITVVLPGSEAAFLAPLGVRAMSGIGPATERRLAAMGIRTLGQLAQADPKRLRGTLGAWGPELRLRASGEERQAVASRAVGREAKSVSNERTFAHDLMNERDVRAALSLVCSMVGRRMRRAGLVGATVTVKLKYDIASTRTAQTALGDPTDDEGRFGPVAQRLLGQLWGEGMGVRLVGVGLSELSPRSAPAQLELFADDESPRERRLHQATDLVRERFGDGALALGRELRLSGQTTGTAPKHHMGA